jgi:nucleoside-diphosphate-sugar epimerase
MTSAPMAQPDGPQIAVIGGSGFIGSRLVRHLRDSHAVIIIDKRISDDFPELCHQADVRDEGSLRRCIPLGAILVNLAAEHRDDVTPRSLYDEVNVQGARNLCAVAREKAVQTILFTSTVAVYGFAPIGTDESGRIAPFADYGRTKYEAEGVFRAWQAEDPDRRCLVIVRPTVVFGERNRGNVYNLFRQIASGKFVMVGNGTNRKSVAYVENLTAFLEHRLTAAAGVHLYNYIDKPDFDMNALVAEVRQTLGKPAQSKFRLPYPIALALGRVFDVVAAMSGRKFAISAIRVKKFTSNSVYNTAITPDLFTPPVPLGQGIARTIAFEFIEDNSGKSTFVTE